MGADTLTKKQAEAIALVHEGFETKEIARILKIAPSTVDQRIDGARKKLGASTRAQAGRIFAAQGHIPERFIYEPLPLTPADQSAPPPILPRDDLRFQDAMFDERAAWDRGSLWHLPAIAPRDLGKAGRLLAVFALALLMMLGAGEAVDLFRGLGSLLSR